MGEGLKSIGAMNRMFYVRSIFATILNVKRGLYERVEVPSVPYGAGNLG